MKILLLYPPGNTSFISPPLGLLYIAATLLKDNHEVYILDYLIENFTEEHLAGFIKDKKIELVGISVVTPLANQAKTVSEIIRKNFPEIKIIMGGPHPTLLPEETLKNCPAVDFLTLGEGELRLPKLIASLNENNFNSLDGLAFRQENEIVINPVAEYIEDLDRLPFPARHLVDLEKYSRKMASRHFPATTMFTTRGCPFHCIYCSKPISGKMFRKRSPENVIKEIELLKRDFGIKEIIFYDDTITFDRERIWKICQLLIEKRLNIKWKCETRVNLVDKELLQKMKEAGCYMIAFGIESGSQRVLDILRKGITLQQIENAVGWANSASISVLGYFMLGIPGETEEEIEATIKLAKRLNIDYAQFSIATAFPGTELYEIAKKAGKIDTDWSKSFYALSGVKAETSLSNVPIEKLREYLKKAYRSFYFRPGYIWRRIKNIRTTDDLRYNLKGIKKLLKI